MKFLTHGKKYLIKFKDENTNKCYYGIRQWFNKRITKYWTYKDGFYKTQYYYNPCGMTILDYIDMNNIPEFYTWKMEKPIEGEWYLVYRVGHSYRCTPHYTIRKYRNGSFGSMDVKYWIKPSVILS